MIEQFKDLAGKEIDILLKAPVLVSLLAASRNHKLNKAEKADAIKLSHFKTFTADEILIPYYEEAGKHFTDFFETAEKEYAPFDEAKLTNLKAELQKVNTIISKLDKYYARALHKSLEGYANHVKKSDRSFVLDFVFPMPIPGLTD